MTPEESTQVDMFTGTTSSMSRTAAGKLAAVTEALQQVYAGSMAGLWLAIYGAGVARTCTVAVRVWQVEVAMAAISASEARKLDAIVETSYLLRTPANARRLTESIEQWRAGQTTERDLETPAWSAGHRSLDQTPR